MQKRNNFIFYTTDKENGLFYWNVLISLFQFVQKILRVWLNINIVQV